MEKKKFLNYIDEKADVITNVSDRIWEYAELSLMEFKSAELYCKVLKEEGFTVETPVAGIKTAFKAIYGSGKPVIGILAEYDALTGLSQKAGTTSREELDAGGCGHGCGHAWSRIYGSSICDQKISGRKGRGQWHCDLLWMPW